MRRTIAVFVAALMVVAVLALAGCAGGGSGSQQPSTPASGGGGSAPPPPPTAAASSTAQLSAKPITEPRAFPELSASVGPAAVIEALKSKRAFMIVFYDSRQTVTGDEKSVIDKVATKFRGMLDVITYDLAAISKAKEGTAAGKTAVAATDLAQKLDAGFQPDIVITDKSGQITWQSTGFYDEGTLEREILRATQ